MGENESQVRIFRAWDSFFIAGEIFCDGTAELPAEAIYRGENLSRQNDFSGRKHSEKEKSGSRKGPDLLPNILAEGDAVF